MYDDIIESRMTNGDVNNKLREMYNDGIKADGDGGLADLLREQPRTAYDYICRYTFWAQCMAGRYTSETQYQIMHQLVRAYAMHAALVGDIAAKVPTAVLGEIQQSVMAALQAHPMPEVV